MIAVPVLDDICFQLARQAEEGVEPLEPEPFAYLMLAIGSFVNTARVAEVPCRSDLVEAFARRSRSLFWQGTHESALQMLRFSVGSGRAFPGARRTGEVSQPLAMSLAQAVLGVRREAFGYLILSGLAALQTVRSLHGGCVADRFLARFLSTGTSSFSATRYDEARASASFHCARGSAAALC